MVVQDLEEPRGRRHLPVKVAGGLRQGRGRLECGDGHQAEDGQHHAADAVRSNQGDADDQDAHTCQVGQEDAGAGGHRVGDGGSPLDLGQVPLPSRLNS